MPTAIPAAYQGWVSTAARGTGLPASVVAAQINMESGFNPRAVSPAGAQGIAQFEPGTWKSNAPAGSSPFDPNASLSAYTKLMGTLLNQFGGNVRNALAAYNAGPGNLKAGYGYADTILGNAGQGGGVKASSSGTMPGLTGLTGPTTAFSFAGPGIQFDQAAYDKAVQSAQVGRLVSQMQKGMSVFGVGPKASVSGGSWLGPGLLSTAMPSASDYTSSTAAQTILQQLAGDTALTSHPGTGAAAQLDQVAQSMLGKPYVYGGGHGAASTKLPGYDCSGFVSNIMEAAGIWNQAYATPSIPTAPNISPGQGQSVTIWNNPNPGSSGHVWIMINGKGYESAGGGLGSHQMSQSEVKMYLASGQYKPFHPAGM